MSPLTGQGVHGWEPLSLLLSLIIGTIVCVTVARVAEPMLARRGRADYLPALVLGVLAVSVAASMALLWQHVPTVYVR